MTTVSMRPSTASEWQLAHDVTRDNMMAYYRARGREWDSALFQRSWPTTLNYTLEAAGAVAGFLRLARTDSVVTIRDIQLAEGFRGQGIGSFAIEAAERFATERGLHTLQLNVFRSNPAIRLYERLGFHRVGESDGVVSLEKNAVNSPHPRRDMGGEG